MKTEFKSTISPKKTLSTITIFFALSAIFCCLIGDILLPLCIGLLSVLYVFGEKTKHAKAASVAIIAFNVVVIFLGITSSLFGFAAVVLAKMLAGSFLRKGSKADNAYMMTVVCSLFTVGAFVLLAMFDTGRFTVDAVMAYYEEIGNVIRELMLKLYGQVDPTILQASGLTFSAEDINYIVDYMLSLVIAYVFIASFIAVGLSMKLFKAVSCKIADDKAPFEKWQFNTTPIFAYFYLILTLASMFVEANGDALSIAIINLNAIFSAIFIYVGYKALVILLSRRMNPKLAGFLIIVGMLVLSSLATQIVSIFGLFYTINRRRFVAPPTQRK